MKRTRHDWSIAYATQALADLTTFDRMCGIGGFPECHKLLMLQMGCEKLVKAHLCNAGSRLEDLHSSHGYTAKNLPIIINMMISKYSVKSPAWVLRHARHLANEVELLSPQVDRNQIRPDNCEYPWEDESGVLHIPAEWEFSSTQLLNAPVARTFLKLIALAAKELSHSTR